MYRLTCGIAGLLLWPIHVHAQDSSEIAFVKELFNDIQPLSIRKNREYCGYIGYDFDGRLTATEPHKGRKGSCLSPEPDILETIIASYHTHGAYSSRYYNEVPSGVDMEGDEEEGIDGWVATPGGRLWYVDSSDMITTQICGLNCLVADPEFVEGDMGPVKQSYTYDDLVQTIEDLDEE